MIITGRIKNDSKVYQTEVSPLASYSEQLEALGREMWVSAIQLDEHLLWPLEIELLDADSRPQRSCRVAVMFAPAFRVLPT